MNPEPPPVLNPLDDTALPSGNRVNLGRLGLQLSLLAPAVFLLFMVLRPG